ncbi:helix-turn-helix domain-containing protein [Rhizobium sp. VS19-DR104.2]|uniref:helix-turn-helix domain-containing protein n=1 Tax=unclassified Rhizobium TaxID=2613769 RepID=UPI001C5B5468|nr:MULTISPECIES: helix-turn-helix domain-containing protein [unclassified Rhizobium]MBZ5763672.1 helix-turn-helix domain-containing protein [Rhizobium sp. VS19-DR96]MBZ5769596.1 helix-turn-helix domain-containing protein [Rhizobium sp. VS19-DR129.2]MBZ5777025.1 helix-turn-helix domain-containing protein [Rhizobium sp. VS19-DRK62.2]MBZ5788120.1 helix-turn-helix domain-containing protein [Rhizobium sp. VS19-DR121]MBZ5805740.1 helix-turn-helix domain-containing protein [Rhizobium sp. VS19-DR181]
MTTKARMPSRLRLEILELANDMHANETLNDADFRKITLREFAAAAPTATPLSAEDIKALREGAHMSQAVFAKYLNLTAGHVSQMERGLKRPTGPALALLNVIRRKGIEVVM